MIASAEALPLVSVVVPVYNVEPYLRECVESIRAQSYENLEIILVDDGSTDGSGDMCDELSYFDYRIKVVHIANSGPSAARNTGLALAQGSLVSFVDSDDCISGAFIETLVWAFVNCDVSLAAVPGGCFFNDGELYELEQSSSEVLAKYSIEVKTSVEYLESILYQKVNSGCHWWLFDRELLGREPFSTDITIGEDIQVAYRALYAAGSVAVVNCYKLYAYRLRSTSLIRQSYSHDKGVSILKFSSQLYDEISRWYPSLTVAASSRCFAACQSMYKRALSSATSDSYDDDLQALWQEIKKHRKVVVSDSCAAKRQRVASAIACLGEPFFRLLCKAGRGLSL